LFAVFESFEMALELLSDGPQLLRFQDRLVFSDSVTVGSLMWSSARHFLMNRFAGLIGALSVLLCPVAAQASSIGLTNAGFEYGDFSGWEVTIPLGALSGGSPPIAVGTALVRDHVDYFAPFTSGPTPFGAFDGSEMAVIGTADWPLHLPGAYGDISVQQTVNLFEGERVSGWSAFFTNDPQASDFAWVRLLDDQGTLLDTVWAGQSGGWDFTLEGLARKPVPVWTQWEWRAPGDGVYTLQLGAHAGSDLSSYAMHDAIRVPEPSTLPLTFISLGVGVLFVARRRSVLQGGRAGNLHQG
jgi:hypothetical protein